MMLASPFEFSSAQAAPYQVAKCRAQPYREVAVELIFGNRSLIQ